MIKGMGIHRDSMSKNIFCSLILHAKNKTTYLFICSTKTFIRRYITNTRF